MAEPGRSPLRPRLVWVGVALIVAVVYGVAGYMLLEGWRFIDSLYMTVTTMTTVGFREVKRARHRRQDLHPQ